MTITTNAAIEVFGDQDNLTNSSASVADGGVSLQSDLAQWTNDDDTPNASVVLSVTFASAPDVSSGVGLYMRMMDIDGTNDQEAPDGNFSHLYVGRFPVNDVTANQFITIDIDLRNTTSSQLYEFYIQNDAGQTMNAGWYLLVTPKTVAPHA